MNAEQLELLLEQVKRGALSVADAREALACLPFEELGFAKVDHHRELRQGVPEVIFAQGKTVEQVCSVARALYNAGATVFATRVSAEQAQALQRELPAIELRPGARTALLPSPKRVVSELGATIVTAGTADLGVAEEAAETLRACGYRSELISDVGVAGLQRLLVQLPKLRAARVIIALAGMEGALPSVLGGLVAAPVVAVPTSTGYGTGSHGFAALLAMLNSCASGVSVVNIDNGFGAGMAAVRLLKQIERGTTRES